MFPSPPLRPPLSLHPGPPTGERAHVRGMLAQMLGAAQLDGVTAVQHGVRKGEGKHTSTGRVSETAR